MTIPELSFAQTNSPETRVKVGFYLENKSIPDVDFTNPEAGNPGSGGSEFLFVALPYYLQKLHGKSISPVIFANTIGHLPVEVPVVEVDDVYDGAKAAKREGCDFFVYRPHLGTDATLLNVIQELQLPSIAWAHITPEPAHLRAMSKCSYLRAFVCVAPEQYDRVQDSPLHRQLACIVNGFDVDGFVPEPLPETQRDLVAYIGALVPQKGFHLLAKAWPRVLDRQPQARLVVIGSGALYDAEAPLGPWGIAEQGYETRDIIPFLDDGSGQPIPSVEFKGKLGLQKIEILCQTAVGVVNPSGHTEQCPGSALEFQAVGTPVVSGAYYGLLDTVVDGETGLLGRTDDDLVANICELLEDAEKANALGANGQNFVRDRFGYPEVASQWVELFSRLSDGREPVHPGFKRNIHRHYKWLVLVNRYLQVGIGWIIPWPSIAEIRSFMTGRLRSFSKPFGSR